MKSAEACEMLHEQRGYAMLHANACVWMYSWLTDGARQSKTCEWHSWWYDPDKTKEMCSGMVWSVHTELLQQMWTQLMNIHSSDMSTEINIRQPYAGMNQYARLCSSFDTRNAAQSCSEALRLNVRLSPLCSVKYWYRQMPTFTY